MSLIVFNLIFSLFNDWEIWKKNDLNNKKDKKVEDEEVCCISFSFSSSSSSETNCNDKKIIHRFLTSQTTVYVFLTSR